MKIGETAIASIQFDPKSRDEIPKLLRGLQAIYCNREVRDLVFEALTELIFHLTLTSKLVAREWIYGKYLFWAPFA